MSSRIEKAISYFSGTKNAWQASLSQFPTVNAAQLAGDFELTKAASQIRDASDPELALAKFQTIKEKWKYDLFQRFSEAKSEFHKADEMYEARIKEAALGPDAEAKVTLAAEECLSDFVSQSADDYLGFSSALEDAVESDKEFKHFRKQNNLEHRAPAVVDLEESKSGIAWIVLVVLVETIANGSFFQEGSTAGLIGGIREAFFLTVLNISLAGILGVFVLRYIGHLDKTKRILAWVIGGFTVVAILFLNLVIAHYREAYVITQGAPAFDLVLTQMASNPLVMSDAKSWLLGALGLVFNGFASYKFYHLKDPYPGYTEVARRRRRALEALKDEASKSLENLKAHRDFSIENAEKIIDLIHQNQGELDLAVRGRARLHSSFSVYVEGLRSAFESLEAKLVEDSGLYEYLNRPEIAKLSLQIPESVTDDVQVDQGSHRQLSDMLQLRIVMISEKYQEMSSSIESRLRTFGVA